MTDLSSPQIQTMLKNNKRTSVLTNAIMVALALLTAGLAIWVAVERTMLKLTDWSVWIFIVLLGVIALLIAFIAVGELFLKRPYRRIIHRFVSEGFDKCGTMLTEGGVAEFELLLAGDKLTLIRKGNGLYVQFDLSPIKRYYTVCNYTVSLVKQYVADYYSVNAQKLGVTQVVLTDKLHSKAKEKVLFPPEKPLPVKKLSFFISSGMITKL